VTSERKSLVEGIWSCIVLLHRSGKLSEPTVGLLLRFGEEDRVTMEEAMAVIAPRSAVRKEQAA
jgi:hypothetical protein